MAALFADLPEALAATVEIAQRCSFRPKTRKPILPRFTAEDGSAVDEAAELRRQAEEGLTRRVDTLGLASGQTIDDYRERLDFELSVIENMKYPGYFLIVADFIQWAKSARHSGRAGARLGRGLARRLRAHHHRPRSDPLRPPVRALPQSGTRVDAGLRYRLLPGPARRGDRLRAATLWPRSGRADHHLRHLAGARRVARRRPRAGNAVRPGRQAVQAGAEQSGGARDALARRSTRSRACRRRATRSRWCGAPSISR